MCQKIFNQLNEQINNSILGYRAIQRNLLGFTLIELMIVLAIVGVVAAYAIPSYQDYLVRGRVTEGLNLVSTAKILVAENAMNGQALDLGFRSPLPTKNVSSINVNKDNGEIYIYYTNRVAESLNNMLVLVPSSVNESAKRIPLKAGVGVLGDVTWECFAKGKNQSSLGTPEDGPLPSTSASLEGKLVPPDCRA